MGAAIAYGPSPTLGVHQGVPMELYHALDAVSASRLSDMKRSPAFCLHRQQTPSTPSEAMAFGTAAHTAILEPDEFEQRYALDPPPSEARIASKDGDTAAAWRGWRNTKEYNGLAAEAAAKGGSLLSSEDWEACERIRENAMASPVAKVLRAEDAAAEVSIIAEDPEHGLLRKVRPDDLTPSARMIVDVKMARDVTPDGFARAAFSYGYHHSCNS